MAGLGILLYGALRSICGIGQAVENKQIKDYSYKIDDKGRPTWIDRQGNQYINGERVVATYDYNNHKLVYAGQRTGKVYYDYQQDLLNRRNTEDEEEKADELSRGKLAYLKYDSISKRRLTCEISTGKFIVELEGRSDGTYWKYYIEEDGCHYIYFNKTKGSPCVQITREEFDALNIKPGTHHAYDANRRRYEY